MWFIDAVIGILTVYVLTGALVWSLLLWTGLGAVDPAAKTASWGLRALWTPAGIALWPIVLRWIARSRRPAP